MAGFIKLHRGWHESEMFDGDVYCERAAWCWLLTNAAWKETPQRNAKGEVVIVGRGQFRTSLRRLADAWGWSVKRVRTFINVLEKCGAVGTAKAQSGTIITICKYDDFQSGGHSLGTEGGTDGAQPRHIKEEGKEIKKKEKTRAVARPDGVSQKVWSDFLKLRRAKKAPLSDTALQSIKNEAAKAGWPLEAALSECVTRGWQGFKSDWVPGYVGKGGHVAIGI